MGDSFRDGRVWPPGGSPGSTVLVDADDLTLLRNRGDGAVTPRHLHREHDELGHLVEGSGVIEIDGVEHPVSAGSTWAIPRGTPHGGRFDGEFTVLVWYTPGDDLTAPDRVVIDRLDG
jgi:mannose-6-phosphate isomerase-like protein (cupin superfamily)